MRPFLICLLLLVATLSANEQSVLFDPPPGWKMAESDQLPRYVEAMVIGESRSNYPPSINVGVEEFNGSLRDYLKIVKRINEVQNNCWKSLGFVETAAGKADLSTVDIQTPWGKVRLLHVILVREGKAIILTGAAKQEEFTALYPILLKSMRTLRLAESRAHATDAVPIK